MKALYWRNRTISSPQLVIIALLSLLGLLWLESRPIEEKSELHGPKLEAAQLAAKGFQAVHLERVRLAVSLDPKTDPAGSGLIGTSHSPIVSNKGHLLAKQTSINPNFAAVIIEMLDEAGVERGDPVAANLTGSFPALNIAVYAALEVMEVEPLVVSSVAASEYGATHPDLTWLDMERVLFERKLVSFRSVAASMGGVLDVAENHSPEGREALLEAIRRNDRPPLQPSSFEDAVQARLDLYDELTGGEDIAAFINVGGGTASVGTAQDKADFRPGLNQKLPFGLENASVMRTFLERGVPVVHLSHVETLARRFDLPQTPGSLPTPGEGGVFRKTSIPAPAIAVLILLILGALLAAARYDMATVFSRATVHKGSGDSEPMV
ncbi:MAG: poly-gamma-glutamate system protein [Myxococcota bacterium]